MSGIGKVEEEYSKNQFEGLKREDVDKLRRWTQEQAHLPQLSEMELVAFLHSCYYDLELAKVTVQTFFKIKAENLHIFGNRNPRSESVRIANNIYSITHLPKLTSEGYKIIFIKLLVADAAMFVYNDHFNHLDMVLMLTLAQTGTSRGIVCLVDQKGVTFRHIAKIGLRSMRVTLNYVQDALPLRVKGLHFFNAPPFVDTLMALMRPFLKSELAGNMRFYSKAEDLFGILPQEYFPEEYGGHNGSISKLYEEQNRNLLANADFFLNEEDQLAKVSKELKKLVECGSGDGLFNRTMRFMRLK